MEEEEEDVHEFRADDASLDHSEEGEYDEEGGDTEESEESEEEESAEEDSVDVADMNAE